MTPSMRPSRPVPSALDELRREHALILEVVERLEASVSPDRQAEPALVRAALAFVRSFVDENHHGKEERVLFPLMQRDAYLSGLAKSLGDDHGESRSLVAAIERSLGAGDDPARLSGLVSSFASLIRDHIRREDMMVFEAAESVLSPADHATLEAGFREVEKVALDGFGADGALDALGDLRLRPADARRR